MADWDLHALLLRLIDLDIRGLQWQNGGGKGSKPRPIELPDGKGRGSRPASSGSSGEETARRLRNLGMIPADAISD
jgi:hypothetical protein